MKLEAEDLKQIAQARKKKEAEVEIEVVWSVLHENINQKYNSRSWGI
jgi:hypothetical protein